MSITYNLNNGLPVFKALSSEIRIKLLGYIAQNEGLYIKQLAKIFHLPITTLSPHLKILESCGLIYIIETSTPTGWQKCCYLGFLADENMIIDVTTSPHEVTDYHMDIPLGSYSDFDVQPTCGLASSTAFIGRLDEPRYFTHPDHVQAKILWFSTGYIEYILPCFLPYKSTIEEISFTFEISSECPSINNEWPSDLTFSMNGIVLGCWTSPGDFGDRKGKYSPDWWHLFMNQYGLLKNLRITRSGTFMDNEKLSDVSIDDLKLSYDSLLRFRISVLPDAVHPGGCTIFGQGFGDYSQNIRATVKYINSPEHPSISVSYPR